LFLLQRHSIEQITCMAMTAWRTDIVALLHHGAPTRRRCHASREGACSRTATGCQPTERELEGPTHRHTLRPPAGAVPTTSEPRHLMDGHGAASYGQPCLPTVRVPPRRETSTRRRRQLTEPGAGCPTTVASPEFRGGGAQI